MNSAFFYVTIFPVFGGKCDPKLAALGHKHLWWPWAAHIEALGRTYGALGRKELLRFSAAQVRCPAYTGEIMVTLC